MSLSPAQITTLRTFVANSADSAIVDARTRGATVDLMNLLNADAAGPVKAWRTAVPVAESDEAPSYTTYDTMGGKQGSWERFLAFPRNFGRNKVRSWITDIWGNATAGSNAEAILLAGVENASVAENAVGGSTKTTGTVTALDRAFVGDVSQENCQKILA
jgi:hypothetical protein